MTPIYLVNNHHRVAMALPPNSTAHGNMCGLAFMLGL